MVETSANRWVVGLVLIYLSAVVLVAGTNAMHLRPDENLVYDYTRNDLGYLVTYLAEQDSHPPLWFSSFWLWRQLMGDSEFVGRVMALFFSLLTLAVVYQIGRGWFGAARYGLFAIALLGVNTYFFIYSLEIRPYGLIMLLVAVSMWLFQRWLQRESWRMGLYYAVTLGLMLYIHYFLFVLMMMQAAWFLLQRPSRRLIKQGVGVALVALLIWLPWLPFAINQVLHVRQAEVVGGNERGLIGAGSTTMPTSLDAVLRLATLASNGQVALYAIMLLVSVVYVWRRANYRLALMWALGVPAISLLVNLAVAVFLPRYVVYLVVGLALALAAGLAALPKYVRWSVLALVVALSLVSLSSQLPADRIPYRDLFQQVSAAAGSDDVIFFDSGGLNDGFVRAQTRRYLDRDLWRRRVGAIDAALAQRRVWYVTNTEWFADSTRQRFAQIERTHPLQQVIGRCDRDWCYLLQLLEAAPNVEPVLFGESLAFRGIDVDRVTDSTISVRLWWTGEDALDLDYSLGLHLLNSAGQLVAQVDSAIVDQYTGLPLPTSQMEAGKLYIDVRDINLPLQLPAGDYELALVVYQSWDNTRLPLADGSDYLALQSVRLG